MVIHKPSLILTGVLHTLGGGGGGFFTAGEMLSVRRIITLHEHSGDLNYA